MIAGSGRSGTTWLLDSLASANGLRPVFEPLHPAVSEIGCHFANTVLLKDDNLPKLEQFFRQVADGKGIQLWPVYRGRRDLLFDFSPTTRGHAEFGAFLNRWRKFLRDAPKHFSFSRNSRPLIKCIHANLMLGWLARKLCCRTVLLVRHPCAVLESQLRGGPIWDPYPVLAKYRKDEKLETVSQGRYRKLLNTGLENLEALTLRWVIENQLPVNSASHSNTMVVFYEQLRNSPDTEWARISDWLGLGKVPSARLIAKPSQQSSQSMSNSQRNESKPRWRDRFSNAEIDRIQSVLDATNCRLYTTQDLLPQFPGNNTNRESQV